MSSTAYGLAWDARRAAYWAERVNRCHRCGRRGLLDVHHPYGAGNRWPVGLEPSWALIGLCSPCHDGPDRELRIRGHHVIWLRQSIHGRHRRWAKRWGWTTDHPRYYRSLARCTWRHVYLGRAFAWRDGFLWMPRLPEWSLPPREWR